jgi:glucosamine kinase
MILIADAGSTKIDWRWIDGEKNVEQCKSEGFNPQVKGLDLDLSAVMGMLSAKSKTVSEISKVYYYGAGVGNEKVGKIIQNQLQVYFPQAKIITESDLLAAARSLCGHRPGVACILGTGSNSCFFDGDNITCKIPPLGYVLGDFGSGTHLGKELIRFYAHNLLSEKVKVSFEKRYPEGLEGIIHQVYKEPSPNVFLGKFSKFLLHHQQDPIIYRLIYDCFSLFLQRQVAPLITDSIPVHVTGSISFYFGNILRQAAIDQGIHLQTILESPIAGLTLYHLEMDDFPA